MRRLLLALLLLVPFSAVAAMHDNVNNPTVVSPLTNLQTVFTGLSVNGAGSGMAFTALTGAPINSTTPGSGTYTGSAPSGLTNVVYGAGCAGSSTVSGFSASAGTWHATFTTPAAGCTGTLTVTGTGANTATTTSPSTVFTGPPTLAFTTLAGGSIGTSKVGSGTYTVSAPSGLVSATYGGGCSGSSSVSGFSASGGTWSAIFTPPGAPCTGTLAVTGTSPNTASATSPSTVFTSSGSACPDDDGSAGASAGTPQSPSLLAGYAATINGTGGLGCLVAGVDYHVGVPSTTTLVVPTSGNIPAGTSISGNVVTISGANVTFQNFDMTGKSITGGGSNTIIQNNKFVVNSCANAPIWLSNTVTGTIRIQYNDIDGGGPLCGLDDNPGQGYADGSAADVYLSNIGSGATVMYQYNKHLNANADNLDVSGPGSGSATILDQFNYFSAGGWGGHPDGIQFCGGNYGGSQIRHNTFVQPNSLNTQIDTQIFHVEAQCGASAISNTSVIFNTTVQPGPPICHSVDQPGGGCTANAVIHCKNDNPPTTSNTGFKAYGNYMDWTEAQNPLGNDCTGASFNTPFPNKDMLNGSTVTVDEGH